MKGAFLPFLPPFLPLPLPLPFLPFGAIILAPGIMGIAPPNIPSLATFALPLMGVFAPMFRFFLFLGQHYRHSLLAVFNRLAFLATAVKLAGLELTHHFARRHFMRVQ